MDGGLSAIAVNCVRCSIYAGDLGLGQFLRPSIGGRYLNLRVSSGTVKRCRGGAVEVSGDSTLDEPCRRGADGLDV